MKILNKDQILAVDQATIIEQQISSSDLMERAASAVYQAITNQIINSKVIPSPRINIFCGSGNNGGDGLVLARLLVSTQFQVRVFIVKSSSNLSPDFQLSLKKFELVGGVPTVLDPDSQFPIIDSSEIIIDAIFGTGLKRSPESWISQIFKEINASKTFIISIDLPSGLFLDRPVEDVNSVIFANWTLTFQSPKLIAYLPETASYFGEVQILDIGLSAKFLETVEVKEYLLTREHILKCYRPINKYAHKGTQGHALIIGGSYGKIGAVTLASRSALKSGCGLVTCYLPKCGYEIIQTANPEVMVISDAGEEQIIDLQYSLMPQAIAIGMGMGQSIETQKAFADFLKANKVPLVIDADALNILSLTPELLNNLSENTILTPHPKELERLIGPWDNDFHKIAKTQAFAKKHQVIVLIKGAHSLIISKDLIFVNTTGNPGLATAGSGDVLSGMIASFLAQSYPALDAVLLGVYLHGLAADLAVIKESKESMIASDIISSLGIAFHETFFTLANKDLLL